MQKQNIEVPFTHGEDTTDEPLVLPTKLVNVLNGHFDSRGGIVKRFGWKEFEDGGATPAVIGGGAAPSAPARNVHGFRTKALLEASNGLYEALDNATDVAYSKMSVGMRRASAELMDRVNDLGQVTEMDSAFSTTMSLRVQLYASKSASVDSRTHIFVRVTRIREGREFITVQQQLSVTSSIGNSARAPRVVLSNSDNKFYLYWYENNAIRSATVAGNSVSAVNVVEATAANDAVFDASLNSISNGGRSIFLAHNSAAGFGRFLKLSMTDGYTISANATAGVAFGSGGALYSISAIVSGDGLTTGTYYHAVHAGTTVSTHGCLLDGTLAINTFAVSTTTAQAGRVTTGLELNNNSRFWVYWDDISTSSTSEGMFVFRALCSTTAVVTAEALFLRGVSVGSKLTNVNGVNFIGAYLHSETQSTFYVVDATNTDATSTTTVGAIVAAVMTCGASSVAFAQTSRVPNITAFVDPEPDFADHYAIEVPFWRALDYVLAGTGGGVTNLTVMGTAVCRLHFGGGLSTAEVADSLVLAGACPMQYDGVTVQELGFLHFPETYANSVQVGGVGGAGAGTYQVVFCFEWTDANGRIHRSAPSVPRSIVALAGQAFSYNFPTLRLTRKKNVRLVVFRTEVNGSLFYRVQFNAVGIYGELNNQSARFVQNSAGATDNATDAQLRTGELLYTTGNVLANKAFPACRHVETHDGRLFMCGLEIETQIRYTDELDPAFFPATNEIYTIEALNSAGGVACVKSLDDKLAVFQESQIGYIGGAGPNRLGLQNGYTNVMPSVKNFGMNRLRPQLAVVDDLGAWFFDNRRTPETTITNQNVGGWRHLNRGMQLTRDETGALLGSTTDFFGAGYAPATVPTIAWKSAFIMPRSKQVRFVGKLLDSTYVPCVLVWDQERRQFSEFGSEEGVMKQMKGGAAAGERMILLSNSDSLVLERPDVYSDLSIVNYPNLTAIRMSIRTAWIKITPILGYQRLYRIKILGNYKANGSLFVKVYTDFNSKTQVESALAASTSTYTPQGAGTVDTPFTLEHHVANQKCAAMQFVIEESGNTEGLRLQGMGLQIGVKQGMLKQASSFRK